MNHLVIFLLLHFVEVPGGLVSASDESGTSISDIALVKKDEFRKLCLDVYCKDIWPPFVSKAQPFRFFKNLCQVKYGSP